MPRLTGITGSNVRDNRYGRRQAALHGIESPLVCSPINLFAANDNGIESSFVCCSIKVSADNDQARFDASSLGDLADV